MRTAINAVIIEHSRLLIVEKKGAWILLGGKPKEGEDDLHCLRREVAEELSGTRIIIGNYYKFFKGITPHREDELLARVYFSSLDGLLGNPSGEISRFAWMKYTERNAYDLSQITGSVVEGLYADKHF